MITEKEINAAYATLATRKAALFYALEHEANAIKTYKMSRAMGMMNGRITGKNDHERDASAAAVLIAEDKDKEDAESRRREAEHDYHIASLEVDRIKLIIRLLELSIVTEKAV